MADVETQDLLKPQKRLLTPFFLKKIPPLPTENERIEYPEPSANIFLRLFFLWITPVMRVGYKRTLQPEDLFSLPTLLQADEMTARFYAHTEQAIKDAEEKHILAQRKARGDTCTTFEDSHFERSTAYSLGRTFYSKKDEEDLEGFELPKWLVVKCLFYTFRWQYTFACIILCLANCASTLNPLVSKHLISFVGNRALGLEDGVGKGIGYAIGCTILIFLNGFFINHFFYRSMMTGAQAKAVLTKAILDKLFRLDARGKHDYPSSKITLMMGTDLARVDLALGFQPFLICFPLPIALAIALLIVNIGPVSLIGIAVMIVFMVLIGTGIKKLFKYRFKANAFTDKRVNYVKEVLNNLKIIKFYSWEPPYNEMISDARRNEMKILYRMNVIRTFITSLAMCLALVASMVAFLVLYSLKSLTSSAASIFSSLSLFNGLTQQVFLIPMALSLGSDAFIGIQRIQKFLYCKEADELLNLIEPSVEQAEKMSEGNIAVEVKDGFFSWQTFEDEDEDEVENSAKRDTKSDRDIETETSSEVEKNLLTKESKKAASTSDEEVFSGLENINLSVTKGEFIVVTGSIGTGKLSLLLALAGMMKRDLGSVAANGNLLLCGLPWVQNETFKENILFGHEYDDQFYRDVIYACSLESDLEILPAGENTEIGERGITLSGGQKARINLARSVYANPDIILLDDVLSAVDARVGKHIMEHCMLGLLKDKTRILATHQLSLIGSADRVVFLNGDGTISVGTLEELERTNSKFHNLMQYSTTSGQDEEDEEIEESKEEYFDEEEITAEKEAIQRQISKIQTQTEDEEAMRKDYVTDKDENGGLFSKEELAINGISFDVYKNYAKMGSGFFPFYLHVLLVVLSGALATFCQLFSNTWLSFWIEQKFHGYKDSFYIGIYIMFVFLTLVFLILEFQILGYICNRAAKTLNILAINRLLKAPMAFMDTTPMGRVLNRFTKDTDVLDNEITDQIRFLLFNFGNIIGIVVLCIIYLPWFAIAVPFLVGGFLAIGNFYQASAREIKRLEATKRSHVYNNFNETLTGMNTIKAYNASYRFMNKNSTFVDSMNEAYYLTIANQRWLGIQLDFVASAFALLITLLCVNRVFKVSPASVGLILAYVLLIAGQLSLLVRTYTQVENEFNSAERLLNYALHLPQEKAYVISETQPEPNWPAHGTIEFKDVQLAYRPGLPLVLKHVSFNVGSSEKIGICGRTGAGKSTIMNALYRITELAGGQVMIDGIDISKLGLQALRSKLSIIPQDPVLFQGTIRKNLDPFGESSDEKLWDVLRKTDLIPSDKIDVVKQQDKHDDNVHKFHLDRTVEDDGTNFSLGEKQLLSFARALVRESKILILDEATSSVDYETDNKIQNTIVREFSDCTILCIAHRLKTIVNYDKILVLDKGERKEFDTPWNLFNLEGGIFQQMCEKSSIVADDFERK